MNKAFCTGIRERTISILSGIKAGTFERDEAIALSLLSAMAGESIFLLGLPGVGKSMIARRLKLAFKDASVFEYLMSRFSTPDEIFGPILRGRDIRRYSYDWANLWLINTHNGVRGKIDRIHIEDYPAVKAHLDQYWDKIKDRTDQGETPYNLRNCAYLEDFFKPKALWKIIGSNVCFAFDEKFFTCNNAINIITGNSVELLQFVGLMNSKLFKWYLLLLMKPPLQMSACSCM